jgi:hypothetical protein
MGDERSIVIQRNVLAPLHPSPHLTTSHRSSRMIRSQSRLLSAVLGAAAILGMAATAGAQDVDALRKKYMLTVPEAGAAQTTSNFFIGAPGASTATPLAFGPNWGDAFVGGGYQASTRGVHLANGTNTANGQDDGSVSAGFGIGNSSDFLSLETVITSLSTFRSGFFNRTAFSFQLSRMLDNTSALAVGVENAFIAGGGHTDGTDSWYAVASKVFVMDGTSGGLFKAVTASAGLGNGRFRFIGDVANNKKTVNAFASASLLVHEQVSVIADYTGQDVNLGLSIVPFKAFPIIFTPAIADITQTASQSARFVMGVGIGMHF